MCEAGFAGIRPCLDKKAYFATYSTRAYE